MKPARHHKPALDHAGRLVVPPVFVSRRSTTGRCAGGASAGGLSLNGYMMRLIAAIMLPMLILVAIIAWDYG